MKKLSKVWLAGFIDADGCISTSGSHGANVKVTATNTYLPVLEQLQRQYGGHVGENGNRKHNPRARACFNWQLTKRDVIHRFLTDILPHLRIKYAQAEQALALNRLVGGHGTGSRMPEGVLEERLVLAEAIRALNQRKGY